MSVFPKIMKNIDFEILSLFRSNPALELSTSDIVEKLFPTESSHIEYTLQDSYASKEDIVQSKHQKAKLHRRVLHHLKKLESDQLRLTLEPKT